MDSDKEMDNTTQMIATIDPPPLHIEEMAIEAPCSSPSRRSHLLKKVSG